MAIPVDVLLGAAADGRDVTVEDIGGPGWRMQRPKPTWDRSALVTIDHLVPDAQWFWSALESYCVYACCGLAAYNFDQDSVAWSCHLSDTDPASLRGVEGWRSEAGDVAQLERDLDESVAAIRALGAEAVTATIFNDIMSPEGYASLFEDLANKIHAARIA